MPIPGGGPLGGCCCCCPPTGAASSCFAYISCVKVSREQRQQRVVTIENLRGIKRKRKSANEENPRAREHSSRERREKSEREREEIDLLFPRDEDASLLTRDDDDVKKSKKKRAPVVFLRILLRDEKDLLRRASFPRLFCPT